MLYQTVGALQVPQSIKISHEPSEQSIHIESKKPRNTIFAGAGGKRSKKVSERNNFVDEFSDNNVYGVRASADEAPSWVQTSQSAHQSGWKDRLRKDALIEDDKISHKPTSLSNFKTQL